MGHAKNKLQNDNLLAKIVEGIEISISSVLFPKRSKVVQCAKLFQNAVFN